MRPFLSPEGVDFVTGIRHCIRCTKALHGPAIVHNDHVAAHWTHRLWKITPEVIARHPETGHTLEGVVAIPSRRVLAFVPAFTSLTYCGDCFPGHSQDGCGGCGELVDTEDEHSESELLDKNSNGVNANFRRILWHIDCLPAEFDPVRKLRDEWKKQKLTKE